MNPRTNTDGYIWLSNCGLVKCNEINITAFLDNVVDVTAAIPRHMMPDDMVFGRGVFGDADSELFECFIVYGGYEVVYIAGERLLRSNKLDETEFTLSMSIQTKTMERFKLV